jgi:hypothetical protein
MGCIKFTPLDEAIKELYKWYEEHIHSIDREILLVDK